MSIWMSFIHPLSRMFRRRRAQEILRLMPDFNDMSVLDLGGSRHFWEKMGGILKPRSLKILNVADNGATESLHDDSTVCVEIYDGIRIPYPDEHFDVVICNSVIEHVLPCGRRGLMREVERVGKSYFVQTPAFSFPLEPHFLMPFMHWMPRAISRQIALVSTFRWMTGLSAAQVMAYFEETRLLTKTEFSSYMPSASVSTERFLGLPKSYTLYRLAR